MSKLPIPQNRQFVFFVYWQLLDMFSDHYLPGCEPPHPRHNPLGAATAWVVEFVCWFCVLFRQGDRGILEELVNIV